MLTLSKVANINWGSNIRWLVQFPDAPPPFGGNGIDSWFPATEVEENLWTLNSEEFSLGNSTFKVPSETTLADIKVTFLDTVVLTVTDWLTQWVHEKIAVQPNAVNYLEDCVEQMNIIKLNNLKEPISVNTYWVYPEGAYYFSGGNTPETLSGSLDFIAVCYQRQYVTTGSATVGTNYGS